MKRPHWLPSEDRILLGLYSSIGTDGCHQHLPHRTREAVQQRASKLGLVSGTKPGGTGRVRSLHDVLNTQLERTQRRLEKHQAAVITEQARYSSLLVQLQKLNRLSPPSPRSVAVPHVCPAVAGGGL